MEYILDLIRKNLECRADGEERSKLNEWISHSDSNKQYYQQVMNIWDASDCEIDIENIDTEKAWEKVVGRVSKKIQKRTFWYHWKKAVAILMLPLAFGVIIWMYNRECISDTMANEPVYHEVYAAFGTRSALRLTDSSLVWLNSGSRLRYPDRFGAKERKVYLTGEAYFEIESDLNKPFIVNTPALSIEVTGTKFNILDYDTEPLAEITLVEGGVIVNRQDKTDDPKLISSLDVSQHLAYDKETGEKKLATVDTYKYYSWKDGKLIFRDEPIDVVAKKIGKIFNVDIEIRDTNLRDYRFWATFQDESLDEILKNLSRSSPITYTELDRKQLPDGSFPKKKIVLFYRK